jgi:DNA processing protein
MCDIFVLQIMHLYRMLITMNSAETLAILRLARTQGVGPSTFRRALLKFGSAQHALENAAEFVKNSADVLSADDARREYENLTKLGGNFVVLGSENYPTHLAELPDAPIVLSVLGNANLLNTRQVGMVGNRSASGSGMAWSEALAHDLAKQGITITSGLARGIDTAAHNGALAANGATIAIVAGGVDHIYPPENKLLREKIIAHGAVVSEQAFGMAPTAHLFPRRNRIIAGLSVGVVVSEATQNSGSLITAQCALEYGREVFAVPGSPADPRAAGPNWLLKNGATLIENAADILSHLPARAAPFVAQIKPRIQANLFSEPSAHNFIEDSNELPTSERQNVFALLSKQPLDSDTLARQAKVSETDLSIVLTDLELDGLAVREADGRWRRA